jgi:hypothetical protein
MSKKSRTSRLYENIKADLYYHRIVTKEWLAKRYGAREHEVANVLFMLNLEGFVHQPSHPQCPDRGITKFGSKKEGEKRRANKCWHPDTYVSRVYLDEAGYTIFEVIVALALLFGLAFAVVAFFALLKYLGWYG